MERDSITTLLFKDVYWHLNLSAFFYMFNRLCHNLNFSANVYTRYCIAICNMFFIGTALRSVKVY